MLLTMSGSILDKFRLYGSELHRPEARREKVSRWHPEMATSGRCTGE